MTVLLDCSKEIQQNHSEVHGCWGLTPAVCRGAGWLLAVMDPHAWSEGVNCSVMFQTHPSRSGQLRSRPCFHFVFRRPDKGSRMLFCLHLATCAPSLKVESPLPDQRAVKWSWKAALSTSSPQLSSHSRVLHVVRFIAFCVNTATKTNKSSPTPWLSFCPDPLTHS